MSNNLYNIIPISRAVKDAANDLGEDLASNEAVFTRWAVRALRDFDKRWLSHPETIQTTVPASGIVEIPCNAKEISEVYVIDDCGDKLPLSLGVNMPNRAKAVDECCSVCGQEKAKCEYFYSETRTPVEAFLDGGDDGAGYYYGGPIGGSVDEGFEYFETITMRLLPTGQYIKEKRFPVYDPKLNTGYMRTEKMVIASTELLPCGCVKDAGGIKAELMADGSYSIDECCTVCDVSPKYRDFLEDGYIEFRGMSGFLVEIAFQSDIPRDKNGELIMPEAALEAVIESIKFRYTDRSKSRPMNDKVWRKNELREAVKVMRRKVGRVSLSYICELVHSAPQFY